MCKCVHSTHGQTLITMSSKNRRPFIKPQYTYHLKSPPVKSSVHSHDVLLQMGCNSHVPFNMFPRRKCPFLSRWARELCEPVSASGSWCSWRLRVAGVLRGGSQRRETLSCLRSPCQELVKFCRGREAGLEETS